MSWKYYQMAAIDFENKTIELRIPEMNKYRWKKGIVSADLSDVVEINTSPPEPIEENHK